MKTRVPQKQAGVSEVRLRPLRWLPLVAVLLLSVVPMVRMILGAIPLYLSDLLLLGVFAVFFHWRTLPPRQRSILRVGLAYILVMVPSLIVAFIVYDQPSMTMYYWGRRVLALSAFASFLAIFSARPVLRRATLRTLAFGLVATSVWAIGQLLTRSTGVIGVVDQYYYGLLSSPVKETLVTRWAAEWKTVRAIAGWWNPNTAGAALALMLSMLPALRRTRWITLTYSIAWVALLATASRGAVIGATLAIVVAVLYGRWAKTRGVRKLLLVSLTVGSLIGVGLASEQLNRITGITGSIEGDFSESFGSRWNNYPPVFAKLADSSLRELLFGGGAEGFVVATRMENLEAAPLFVSNLLLLTLLENGVVVVVVLMFLLVKIFWMTREPWQRGIVVLVFWLMNVDNHLYMVPGLAALMAIALALAAAPAVQDMRKVTVPQPKKGS